MLRSQSAQKLSSDESASRISVMNSLIEKPKYIEEISRSLNLAVSTVSFHLNKLEKAGLVTKTSDRSFSVYRLKEEAFSFSLKEIVSLTSSEKNNRSWFSAVLRLSFRARGKRFYFFGSANLETE